MSLTYSPVLGWQVLVHGHIQAAAGFVNSFLEHLLSGAALGLYLPR